MCHLSFLSPIVVFGKKVVALKTGLLTVMDLSSDLPVLLKRCLSFHFSSSVERSSTQNVSCFTPCWCFWTCWVVPSPIINIAGPCDSCWAHTLQIPCESMMPQPLHYISVMWGTTHHCSLYSLPWREGYCSVEMVIHDLTSPDAGRKRMHTIINSYFNLGACAPQLLNCLLNLLIICTSVTE